VQGTQEVRSCDSPQQDSDGMKYRRGRLWDLDQRHSWVSDLAQANRLRMSGLRMTNRCMFGTGQTLVHNHSV
jgi:hypothetical protein